MHIERVLTPPRTFRSRLILDRIGSLRLNYIVGGLRRTQTWPPARARQERHFLHRRPRILARWRVNLDDVPTRKLYDRRIPVLGREGLDKNGSSGCSRLSPPGKAMNIIAGAFSIRSRSSFSPPHRLSSVCFRSSMVTDTSPGSATSPPDFKCYLTQ